MFDWHLNTPLGCFFLKQSHPCRENLFVMASREGPVLTKSGLIIPLSPIWKCKSPSAPPYPAIYVPSPSLWGFFNFWVLSCWKEGVGVGMFMLKGMLKHKILAAPKRHFNIVLLSFEQKDKYCRSTWNI